MLEAKELYKSYSSLTVLKGINLKVEKGEIVSIVGASGAGKSTLLQILGTLDYADHGQLFINGIDVRTLRGNQLSKFRNEQIGFIFQFHNLLPEFSALENVCLPGFLGKKEKGQVEARGKELLDFLGLGERMHHKPNQMSGGEQQRTAVARALINSPAIIFADEPSGNLDSNTAESLHQMFFRLRQELGQTFVIVTHNTTLAENADRKLVIKDGLMQD